MKDKIAWMLGMDYFIVQFYKVIDFDKMIEAITSIHIVVFETVLSC